MTDHGFEGEAALCIPCEKTLRNWAARPNPFEMTGGTERHKLVGQDQFLMVFFISVYPDADADEVATYIVNNGGGVYDRQTISKRLQELEFTRKRASTEAYQAFYRTTFYVSSDF